jgi:hypothetical protein
MKCPKCGYVSHDYLDACRSSKCGIDLVDFKAQMQLHVIQAGYLDLVTVLGGSDGFGAAGAMNEPFLNSQMLMESEESGDFDISLDDDLSLAKMSITVDESADISGMFARPGFSFDMNDVSASSMSDRTSTGPRLGPPTRGYATVMLDVGDMADPNDPPGEAVDAAVDTPTGNDTSASRDLDDPDAGFTPPAGVDSTIAVTAEHPLSEMEMSDPDLIPSHTDAVTIPAESGEIDLNREHFSPSFEVAETPLASETIDDLDLSEMDLPTAPLSTPAEEDVSASTEAAFADFLPLQSEATVLPSLNIEDEAPDDDPDATMVDDANTLTLADEVFDLSSPPTQEITHVDTQEVTQDQVLQDDDFVLPAPSITGEQELDQPQDAAPADDTTSETLTDDGFVLPAPPTQEVTLVDTQDATQEQIPQDDDFALPPLPMQELTSTHPQDVTMADGENSQTLLDGMFNRPSELTQERTLIETQEGDRVANSLTREPPGVDPETGTPPFDPEADDTWLEDDAELELGDETLPAS